MKRIRQSDAIKIGSLGLGLAMGLVLLAKVFFESRYESFWPASERIYALSSQWQKWGEDAPDDYFHSLVSGGVAPAFGQEIPQVEAATRYTTIGEGSLKLLNAEREVVEAYVILADSCFYDVLPRPLVAGQASLRAPRSAIVSRSLAAKLGVEPGDEVRFDEYPGRAVTVEGVFEDVPENSDIKCDMAVALASIADFMWDGSSFWDGNDRYRAFLRLAPGVEPQELTAPMRAVQERHQDMAAWRESGEDIRYGLVAAREMHARDEGVRRAGLLMLALAVALIAIALVNYLIITLSTVLGRAREVATRKCYGASGAQIRRMVLAEAALHIALSLGAAAAVVGAFEGQVREILGASLGALFTWQACAIVAGVCAVLLAVAAWVPSRLFVGVAATFRGGAQGRRGWKLALLTVQFAAAAAFVAILAVIWRQYDMMMTMDPGYEYENVVWANVQGTSQTQRETAVERLRAMAGVEKVSVASNLPPDDFGGNNVYLPGSPEQVFNIADLYGADDQYFDLWEIPVIEGRKFGAADEMMVSRRFAERLTAYTGWTDGVVGKTVCVTGHPSFEHTIVGVYEDFLVGSAASADDRPTALFYGARYWEQAMMDVVAVRLRSVSGASLAAVQEVLQAAMPQKAVWVNAMKNTVAGMYSGTRTQLRAIVLCSLVTLLIVLMGLVGYLRNEIARRSAEIAIRKINGAREADVLRLLGRQIFAVALPALAAGSGAAWWVARRWLEGFSERVALSAWLFFGAGAVVLVVILAVTVAVSWRIAVQNPVKSLKTE